VTRDAEVTEVDIGLTRLNSWNIDHLAGFGSRRVRARLSVGIAAVAARVLRALTEAVSM